MPDGHWLVVLVHGGREHVGRRCKVMVRARCYDAEDVST